MVCGGEPSPDAGDTATIDATTGAFSVLACG